MELLSNKFDCCGCAACSQKCPADCLTMHSDAEGFPYPEIDEKNCVGCGLCKDACFLNNPREPVTDYELYAAKNRDDNIRFLSSSGGIFTLLAEKIIDEGGVVFGACFDEGLVVRHGEAHDKEGLAKFRKSKYIQSDIGNTFAQAKKYLDAGRKVLYSGVPCQIAGLKAFLGREYDELYAVDLICTGVSSPGLWRAYLASIEKEAGSKVSSVVMRDKEINDSVLPPQKFNLTVKALFENGAKVYQYTGVEQDNNPYFHGFLSCLFLRPSCCQCAAKGLVTGSDIELGDFHSIWDIYPEFCDRAPDGTLIPFGISEVIVLTEKGKSLYKKIEDQIIHFQAEKLTEDIYNWYLVMKSSRPHPNRDAFFSEFIAGSHLSISDLIRKHLIINGERENVFGVFGSFASRQVFRSPAGAANLNLGFQFRNSNIISIMSQPVELRQDAKMPANPFRKQMLKDDCSKEFARSFSEYAKEVQFLCIDFLEERFLPIRTENPQSYITKSDSYMDAPIITGIPLIEDCTELWEEKCLSLIDMIKAHFKAEQVFLFEFYLNQRLEAAGNPLYHYSFDWINKINCVLRDKYVFFRKHFDGINAIKIPSSSSFQYTDRYHEYGCLPEHYNNEAYQYAAEEVLKRIQKMSHIPVISETEKSDARRALFERAGKNPFVGDPFIRMDAHTYSQKYMTMRDWLYKKTMSRPIDKYLRDNGYKNTAVYGMGEIGQLLLWELRSLGINVPFAIDKDAESLFSEIPLLTPDDEFPEIDAIVVSVPFAFDQIKQMMAKKTTVPIISVRQLIYEA